MCGPGSIQVAGHSQSYGETYLIPSETANVLVVCQ